jgi:rubrerythrin
VEAEAMSIIESLRRLIDPVAVKLDEEDRKRLREEKGPAAQGDQPPFLCRMCGYTGKEPTFCPKCLADTMQPLKPAKPTT